MAENRQQLHNFSNNTDTDDTLAEEMLTKDALRRALAAERKANRAKSDFISRMSHDMRTPLNAIIGMNAIAAANLHNPEKLADCIQNIDISAKFLRSLINDILDMSQIESGKLTPLHKEFNFHNFIQNIAALFRSQADSKGLRFDVSVEEDFPAGCLGDELRLQQILMNLLGNAIKFTSPPGSVRLCITRRRTDTPFPVVCFEVTDTGRGISPTFQKKIFEPFEQEETNAGHITEGSGLGMSITRSLVHLMNGSIALVSEPGKGSSFTVVLPLELHETQHEAPPPPEVYSFHGEHILLAEDNAINLEIAQTLLEMKGLLVDTASNGQQAVERFLASPDGFYQLILMDIRMPVMDGIRASAIIRSLPRKDASLIPVIAMTADAFCEDETDAKYAGMNGSLTKPLDCNLLYRTLHELFNQ